MSGTIIDPVDLIIGQTHTVDLAAFAQDNAHLLSQVPDTTTTLTTSVDQPTRVSVSFDPANNRHLKITGVAVGAAAITVNEFLVLATGNTLVIDVNVIAMPDNRRIDGTFES